MAEMRSEGWQFIFILILPFTSLDLTFFLLPREHNRSSLIFNSLFVWRSKVLRIKSYLFFPPRPIYCYHFNFVRLVYSLFLLHNSLPHLFCIYLMLWCFLIIIFMLCIFSWNIKWILLYPESIIAGDIGCLSIFY